MLEAIAITHVKQPGVAIAVSPQGQLGFGNFGNGDLRLIATTVPDWNTELSSGNDRMCRRGDNRCRNSFWGCADDCPADCRNLVTRIL